MDMNEYQDATDHTAIYPDAGEMTTEALTYVTLGLVGEAGEIANKVKKVLRDHNGTLPSPVSNELRKELGDVLWYIARLATELDADLGEVAVKNIEKLESRKQRGTISGSGDNR